MKQIRDDFSDERFKGGCPQCGTALADSNVTKDHIPSKALLDEPLPSNVHSIYTCRECNNGFADDEEYFAALLGATLAGSTEPAAQPSERSKRIFATNARLKRDIEAAKLVESGTNGNDQIIWQPDLVRINRIVVKNARGHVFHELGFPVVEEPEAIWTQPLQTLGKEKLEEFLDLGQGGLAPWPEVGSRLFQRACTGDDMIDGWTMVAPGIYRFAVMQTGGVTVRSIIREYLATEVIWDDI